MVTRTVLLTLLGISAVIPARADGILEQMQNEVAAITIKTRAAVVAVQDDRKTMAFQFFTPTTTPNDDQKKRLESLHLQEAKIGAQLEEQADKLARLRMAYDSKRTKEALAQLDAANALRRELEIRRTALKREAESLDQLYRRQSVAALENSLISERVSELSRNLSELQRELPALKTKYANDHPLIKKNLEASRFLKVQLDQLKAQMQTAPAQQVRAFNILRASSGTGFSIGEGYVITTADVVEPMENPVVVTDKGTRIKAKIIGVNGELNIGLLKLLAETDLPSLVLGDSKSVQPGHFALSISNQTGDPNSVALNLVGGRREQGTAAGSRFYPSLIQIAGTVGAGTSGAPLMNAKGEVVGVMVAIPVGEPTSASEARTPLFLPNVSLPNLPMPPSLYSTARGGKQSQKQATEGYERAAKDYAASVTRTFSRWNFNNNTANAPFPVVTSAGYALPINEIKEVVEQLKSGQVTRGWIGIAPEDEEQTQEQNGIINTTRQVRITGVFPESPALQAGIQPGDVLLRINNKPVRNSADVRETSMRLRPGDTLTLRVIRFEKQPSEKTIELKILPRPMDVKPAITTPIKKNSP